MDKKTYSTPAISMMTIEENLMDAVSGGVNGNGTGIDLTNPVEGGNAADAAAKGNGSSLWPADDED